MIQRIREKGLKKSVEAGLYRLPKWARIPSLLVRNRLLKNTYETWLSEKYPELAKNAFEFEKEVLFEDRPLFTLVTLVYDPAPSLLKRCASSVMTQTYDNFEWVVINNGCRSGKIRRVLDGLQRHPRIRVLNCSKPLGITAGTNRAVETAQGEWLAFLDHDDILHRTALEDFAKVAVFRPKTQFIYCDSDHCDEVERRFSPVLKPKASPEYLLNVNYVTHFHATRKSNYIVHPQRNALLDGSQDWDVTLQGMESRQTVYHIPKILYSHRVHPGQYTTDHMKNASSRAAKQVAESQLRCLSYHLERNSKNDYQVDSLPKKGHFYVSYSGKTEPKVTLLWPDRGNAELTESLTDLQKRTRYSNYVVQAHQEHFPSDLFEEFLSNIETPYVAYLSPKLDVQNPLWLREFVGLMERERDVALTSGRITLPSGKTVPTATIFGRSEAPHFDFLEPSSSPSSHIDPSVRREVSGLWNLWWVGRTDQIQKAYLQRTKELEALFDIDLCLQLLQLDQRIIYDAHMTAVIDSTPQRLSAAGEIDRFLLSHADRLKSDRFYSPHLNPEAGRHYELLV